jgi:hypothetical protein
MTPAVFFFRKLLIIVGIALSGRVYRRGRSDTAFVTWLIGLGDFINLPDPKQPELVKNRK